MNARIVCIALPVFLTVGTGYTELALHAAEAGRVRNVADVFASFKAELAALSAEYPQLAGVKDVATGEHGMTYSQNCRYLGKRGYDDTGPGAVAIGIEVMTLEEFSEKVKKNVEMQAPGSRWENLGMVGWTTLHLGKDVPPTLARELEQLLQKHVAMIDELDRSAVPSSGLQSDCTFKGITTDWVGRQDGLRIRAEVFPETFRLGETAIVHLHFDRAGSFTTNADLLETNTGLKANGGRFTCLVQKTVPLTDVLSKNLQVLKVRPWGPVFGSIDAIARPGPAEMSMTIHSRKTISAADGSSSAPIDTWQFKPIQITLLPHGRVTMATSDEALKLAAWRTRLEYPQGGKKLWEALAAQIKPGMTVAQMKIVLPPAQAEAGKGPREIVLFDGSSFTIMYALDAEFGVEASGTAKAAGPEGMVLAGPPRIKALKDIPEIKARPKDPDEEPATRPPPRRINSLRDLALSDEDLKGLGMSRPGRAPEPDWAQPFRSWFPTAKPREIVPLKATKTGEIVYYGLALYDDEWEAQAAVDIYRSMCTMWAPISAWPKTGDRSWSYVAAKENTVIYTVRAGWENAEPLGSAIIRRMDAVLNTPAGVLAVRQDEAKRWLEIAPEKNPPPYTPEQAKKAYEFLAHASSTSWRWAALSWLCSKRSANGDASERLAADAIRLCLARPEGPRLLEAMMTAKVFDLHTTAGRKDFVWLAVLYSRQDHAAWERFAQRLRQAFPKNDHVASCLDEAMKAAADRPATPPATQPAEAELPAWAKAVAAALPGWEVVQCDRQPTVPVGPHRGYRIILRKGRREYVGPIAQQRPSAPSAAAPEADGREDFVTFFTHADLVLFRGGEDLPAGMTEKIPWRDLEQEWFVRAVDLGEGMSFRWFGRTTLYWQEWLREKLKLQGGEDRIALLTEGLFVEDKGSNTANSVMVLLKQHGEKAVPYVEAAITKHKDKEPWKAVHALAYIPGERATGLLQSLYASENEKLSEAAAYALIHPPYRQAAREAYLDMLRRQSYVYQAAGACVEFQWKEAIPILREICEKPASRGRLRAALEAKRSLEGRPIPEEIRQAEHTIGSVTGGASPPDDRAFDRAERLLMESPDKEAVTVAAVALAVHGAKASREKVERVQQAGREILRTLPAEDVRKLLKTLLEGMKGKDEGYWCDFAELLQRLDAAQPATDTSATRDAGSAPNTAEAAPPGQDNRRELSLSDAHRIFVAFVRQEKQRLERSELPRAETPPPQAGDVFVQGFGWIKPHILTYCLALRPMQWKPETFSGRLLLEGAVRPQNVTGQYDARWDTNRWVAEMERKDGRWRVRSVLALVGKPNLPGDGKAGRQPSLPGDAAAQWHRVGKTDLAAVDVERALYEKAGQRHFFVRVRVTNVSARPIAVDLRDYRKVIYPNQWGKSEIDRRGAINERRSVYRELAEADRRKLLSDFAAGKLTTIPAGKSIDYYREFNAGGRADVDRSQGKYLIVSLDGELLLTDGAKVEQFSCDWNHGRTVEQTDLVISAPVPWKTIPADGWIVGDLYEQLTAVKAKLKTIMPQDMTMTRAGVEQLETGPGLLFHASPADGAKAHPSFALFLWPRSNPGRCPYESGAGAHTFVRVGNSEDYVVFYSGPDDDLKARVTKAFCTNADAPAKEKAEGEPAKAMDTLLAPLDPERKRREAEAAARAAAEKAEDEHYRALYGTFKAQILDVVKTGNKDEVAKLTDKFNQSLGGRLLYLRVTRIDDYVRVATTDAPGKMTTLINKPFGDRQIALPNIHYAYSPKPHVTRQTDDGKTYILVETNRLEGGKYADDVFITMAIDTRDPGAWPKGPSAVRQVIALLEIPWHEKLSDEKLDEAAASIKPIADEAVDEIMRAFNCSDQTFAYRHRAVQILERLGTEKARATLLEIALGRSAEHLPSMKQWASAAYLRSMKDKSDARKLLASDDSGVLNNALLAIKGIEVDEALLKRLLELIARKDKEPVSQRAIRHAAAAVMAADPGGKFIPQKVDAILAALADVANMPELTNVVRHGYYTDAEASYHQYLNCLCQMKGANEALRQATGRAAGVTRELLVIARAERGDATVRQDIHRILEDRQAGMRRAWAARGLAAVGTQEDLPILKKVAASDPLERELRGDVGPPDAKWTFFPVREAAHDAARQIESRLRAAPKADLRDSRAAKVETRLADRAATASGDVEVRLRAEEEVRAPGEAPTLKVKVQNKGKRELVFSFWEYVNCRVEWDGTWYRGPISQMKPRSLSLAPESSVEIWIRPGDNFCRDAVGYEPLRLEPGKHVVRVAFELRERPDRSPFFRAVSNEVELTIDRPLPGSERTIEATVRGGLVFIGVCEATSEAVLKSVIDDGGIRPRPEKQMAQPFKVLEVLAGDYPDRKPLNLLYGCLDTASRRERPADKGGRFIWFVGRGHSGSYHGAKALPDTPENRRAIAAEMSWGPVVGGLQCRLLSEMQKIDVAAGTKPQDLEVYLTYELRNVGQQPVRFLPWYTPLEGIAGDILECLGPAQQKAVYWGPRAHRPPLEAKHFITIKSGEKLVRRFRLPYDLTQPGPWRVSIITTRLPAPDGEQIKRYYNDDAEKAGQNPDNVWTGKLTSNVALIHVVAAARASRPQLPPQREGRTITPSAAEGKDAAEPAATALQGATPRDPAARVRIWVTGTGAKSMPLPPKVERLVREALAAAPSRRFPEMPFVAEPTAWFEVDGQTYDWFGNVLSRMGKGNWSCLGLAPLWERINSAHASDCEEKFGAILHAFEDELPAKPVVADIEPRKVVVSCSLSESIKADRVAAVFTAAQLPAAVRHDDPAVFAAASQGKYGAAQQGEPFTLFATMPGSVDPARYRITGFRVRGHVIVCDYESTEIAARDNQSVSGPVGPWCVVDLPALSAGKYTVLFRRVARYREIGGAKPILAGDLPWISSYRSFTVAQGPETPAAPLHGKDSALPPGRTSRLFGNQAMNPVAALTLSGCYKPVTPSPPDLS